MKKVLLALLTLVLCLVGLVVVTAHSVIGTLLSEVHTSITGPGIDIFLLSPPTSGGVLSLEVRARGGNRAGIKGLIANVDKEPPMYLIGKGAPVPYKAISTETSTDSMHVSIPIPETAVVGSEHIATLRVDYVTRMGKSSHANNVSHQESLRLPFVIHSPAEKVLATGKLLAAALFAFVFFGALAFYTARRVRAHEKTSSGDSGELIGYMLLVLLVLSGFVAYWFFAWPVQKATGLYSAFVAVALVLLWFVVPLYFIWRDSHPKPSLLRYSLRLETVPESIGEGEPYRSQRPPTQVWLSLSEVTRLLQKEGYRVRQWFGVVYVLIASITLRVKLGEDQTLVLFSSSRPIVLKIAQRLAAQVGVVYVDDGSSTETIK